MRISAGLLKGRKIGAGKISLKKGGDGYRPTSSKVREAIFDILRSDIEDASFLDLYAGSGTVGFEALSRGAARCCFVESNPRRFREIVSSIEMMGLNNKAQAYREKALDFLGRASRSGNVFGIIFADPPYGSEETGEIFRFLDEDGLLQPDGVVMIEHSSKKVLGKSGRSLRMVRNYRYGDTMLTLFRKDI